jgi:hypothetical protein
LAVSHAQQWFPSMFAASSALEPSWATTIEYGLLRPPHQRPDVNTPLAAQGDFAGCGPGLTVCPPSPPPPPPLWWGIAGSCEWLNCATMRSDIKTTRSFQKLACEHCLCLSRACLDRS